MRPRIMLSPNRAGTAISYANSPENEMRNSRAGVPPKTVHSVQAMNGKASFDRSRSSTTFCNSGREFGPATAN